MLLLYSLYRGGVLGAHCEHDFKHRVFNVAFTYLAQTALVYPLKWTIDEVRPDGSAHNSFPSGHTAAVFAGAELIRMEYGWGWGALFYANAAFVGTMRVVHKRHWWWDAAAGAVLGIGSAHLGKLAADGLYIRLSPNSITLTYSF